MQAGQPNLTGGNKFDKAKTPDLEDSTVVANLGVRPIDRRADLGLI